MGVYTNFGFWILDFRFWSDCSLCCSKWRDFGLKISTIKQFQKSQTILSIPIWYYSILKALRAGQCP